MKKPKFCFCESLKGSSHMLKDFRLCPIWPALEGQGVSEAVGTARVLAGTPAMLASCPPALGSWRQGRLQSRQQEAGSWGTCFDPWAFICQGSTSASSRLPGLTAAPARPCWQDVVFGFCFSFDLCYYCGLLMAQGKGSCHGWDWMPQAVGRVAGRRVYRTCPSKALSWR